MTRFLEWILDLDNIRLATDRPLSIKWLMPLPAWLVFGLSLLLLITVVLIYRREETTPRRRILLSLPRIALIALIMAMICQPVLVLQRNRIEPATVVVLVDNSRSMGQLDGHWREADSNSPSATSDVNSVSRLDRVRTALVDPQSSALATLIAHNRVSLVSFDRGVDGLAAVEARQPIDPLVAALQTLQADGSRSDLFRALSQILQRSQSGPLAGVVLASDGQSTESEGIDTAIDLAKAQKVPIYPIEIGSPVPPLDLAVHAVLKDRQVFAEDRVSIGAEIVGRGLNDGTECAVTIGDENTGAELAAKVVNLSPEEPRKEVEFLVRVERREQARYRLTVRPLPNESDLENNSAVMAFDVITEPLKVLYVEGYPRFEYRYIKNALIREKAVSISCLLLSADNEFAQEGDEPIRRFPQNQEELNQYDVVLFGDIDPSAGWWTPRQAELLVEFVRQRGGGFGVIAGERFVPHRFLDTQLQKLIPVRIDPRFQGVHVAPLVTPYRLRLTSEGRENRLFRFFDDPSVNAATLESLPGMYWLAQTLGPKPASEVLAHHDSVRTQSGPMPLLVQGRYGAGTVLFLGTDDFWQWRRHSGEALHDAFWVQVVRALAPSRSSENDPRLTLTTSKIEYRLGEPIEAMLRVGDSELLATLGNEIPLLATDEREQPAMQGTLARISPESADYSGTLLPNRPGSYTLQLPEIPATQQLQAAVRVTGFEHEMEHPEANHDHLRVLANETGGTLVPLERLNEVMAQIPDRSVQTPDDKTEPLWDSKLVLILFVSIITLEWVGRKAAGMI